ncbi:glycosyltransferase [Asticcacaulis sp.]|uniref:glycosyltransferase n=1 Tax=Asticcacaulis sp. TaxID=1872648 RepID=UPI003F7B9195
MTSSTPVSVKTAISEANYHSGQRQLLVRGWISRPDLTAQVRILLNDGTVVHEGALNTYRKDIATKFELGEGDNAFRFVMERVELPEGAEPTQVTAEFLGLEGESLAKTVRALSVLGDKTYKVEYLAYDRPSRLLTIGGYYLPDRPLMGMGLRLASGNKVKIENHFVYRDDIDNRTPMGRNLHSGFEATVPFVGEGDITDMKLLARFVDDSSIELPVETDNILFNPARGALESVVVDRLNGKVTVAGWFRAYEAVTGIEMSVGGHRLYGFPELRQDSELTRKLGFRDVSATAFSYNLSLEDAFSDGPLADFTACEAVATLYNKSDALLNFNLPSKKVKVLDAEMTLCFFDERSSTFMVWGRHQSRQPLSHLQIATAQRTYGNPKPLVIAGAPDGNETTNWLSIQTVNGVVGPAQKLTYTLSGDDGEAMAGEWGFIADQLVFTAPGALSGRDTKKILRAYLQHNTAPRHFDVPLVCIVLQGSICTTGGGNERVKAMLRSFKNAGYATALIDRSEPWELTASADVYRELMPYCDAHLMLTNLVRKELAAALVERLKAPGKSSHAAKVATWLDEALKKPRGNSNKNDGIFNRADSVFNGSAAALLEILQPRIVITEYIWSFELHDLLPPGTIGLLDTIDVQSLRYEQFRKARDQFGNRAVPVLEKFSVSHNEEVKALTGPSSVIAISRDEKDHLVEMLGAKKVVLAGVGVEARRMEADNTGPASVLFIGNNYEPNNFGINEFIENTWPKVLDIVPKAELMVVGKVCEAVTGGVHASVKLLGMVADLNDYYRNAKLVINPVLFGTGIPVKTIEALGRGKAIVATPEGARGLEDAIEYGALIVSSSDEMHFDIANLLNNQREREALEKKAFDYACAHLNDDIVMSDLMNFIETKLYYS